MEIEIRNFSSQLEIEARDDDKTAIVGHAAVFNSLSENLGGFREIIADGAFDSVLQDDTRALINHDSNLILGRTKSGTLVLSVDAKGLRYVIDPPNTSYANDLLESLKRGDIDQSSFGFVVDEDKWEEDSEGRVIRTIIKVKRLMDVSPVTYPAYPDTDVAKRAMDEYLKTKKEEKPNFDLEKQRKFKLLNMLKNEN